MNDNIIAYKGSVELEKATWDTDWGMYVQFTLDQAPQDKLNANPFKRYTKMRKGKVGTRFALVLVSSRNDPESLPTYDDDGMLKGWSDGTTGWKVTFWVNADPVDGSHPFMEFGKGEKFALAAVELQDDETPVDQVKREKLERKPHKQTLSNFAAMLCREPNFWAYLRSIGVEYDSNGPFIHPKFDGNNPATEWMRTKLGISSRSALDTEPLAAAAFHRDIRLPYADWVKLNVSTEHTQA